MFSFKAGEAVLSLFLRCAGDAALTGANTVLLLLFRHSYKTWSYFSALGFHPHLGWADTFGVIIKKIVK